MFALSNKLVDDGAADATGTACDCYGDHYGDYNVLNKVREVAKSADFKVMWTVHEYPLPGFYG